jgi:NADH-quinone oxidoreductase subunit E
MAPEAQLVENIVERHERDVGMLIPMMQDLQAECGYLPRGHLDCLARTLDLPLTRLYGVATFYSSFRLVPPGEHTIVLCTGTACYLRRADRISEAIQKEFSVAPGGTTEDRKFTFAPVNCLGACALAPVMVVDGRYFGQLNQDSAIGILRKIATGEKVEVITKPKPAGKARKKKK